MSEALHACQVALQTLLHVAALADSSRINGKIVTQSLESLLLVGHAFVNPIRCLELAYINSRGALPVLLLHYSNSLSFPAVLLEGYVHFMPEVVCGPSAAQTLTFLATRAGCSKC